MYVCICHRVGEQEVHNCIRAGARTEDAVGEACDAGTGCGIADMLEAYYGQPAIPG